MMINFGSSILFSLSTDSASLVAMIFEPWIASVSAGPGKLLAVRIVRIVGAT